MMAGQTALARHKLPRAVACFEMPRTSTLLHPMRNPCDQCFCEFVPGGARGDPDACWGRFMASQGSRIGSSSWVLLMGIKTQAARSPENPGSPLVVITQAGCLVGGW